MINNQSELIKKKVILHLCADLGSDSYYYQQDENYDVIRIGKDIGVENFSYNKEVHGIIANPVCTEFSTASNFGHVGDLDKAMDMVNHCIRIIEECKPEFWVLENPFNGRLKEFLGKPKYVYQPWQYGSPWTKKTALWGKFNIPNVLYNKYEDVPKLNLYVRPGRGKVSLAFLHKNDIHKIPEFHKFIPHVHCDADLRSLCSQGFAESFYKCNK